MASPLNPHPNAHGSAGIYHNAHQLARELTGAGLGATDRAFKATRHHAMLLETKIKANASGRPGPRRITGNYLRSWSTDVRHSLGGVTATVGTNAPQGRRLEYGFVGTDRIGRTFNQPPYPHVGPAADVVIPLWEADLTRILTLGGE